MREATHTRHALIHAKLGATKEAPDFVVRKIAHSILSLGSQSLSLEMEVLHAACIVVHFCAVVLAAPPPSPPSLSLLNDLNVNLTAPYSLTQLPSPK